MTTEDRVECLKDLTEWFNPHLTHSDLAWFERTLGKRRARSVFRQRDATIAGIVRVGHDLVAERPQDFRVLSVTARAEHYLLTLRCLLDPRSHFPSNQLYGCEDICDARTDHTLGSSAATFLLTSGRPR
jgi:hypothetical protein